MLEEALAGARWGQENAPESASLKADLYDNIEKALDDATASASSTSSLTSSAAGLKHPHRFITADHFNPHDALVEIDASNEQTGDCARRSSRHGPPTP